MSDSMDAPGSFVIYRASAGSPGKLALPADTAAVVRLHGALHVLPAPGPHVLRSTLDALLGRDVPAIWLVPTAAFVVHPHLIHWLAYDGVLMEADLLVKARVADPLRFWQAQVAGRPGLSEQELRHSFERELQPVLRTAAGQYLAETLQHDPDAAKAVQQRLAAALRLLCEGWGLHLLAVTDLSFWPALKVVEEAERAQAIQRRLAEIELQAAVDALEDEAVRRQARADFGLTPADEAELAQVAAEGSASAAWTAVLDAKLARMQEDFDVRLDALAGVPPAASGLSPAQSDLDAAADDRMSKWIAVLRVTGATLTLIATAGAIWYPEIIRDGTALRLAAAGLGFVAAIAAFASAYFLHRRQHRRRAEAARRQSRSTDEDERSQRIAQERGIRRYLEQRLRQVSSNADQAWRRIYDHDVAAATDLRLHAAQAYAGLADTVMATDYPTSAYFSRSNVPVEDLAQMLVVSQGVLDEAQAMVTMSQGLYQAAIAGDVEAVRRSAMQLDAGRIAIENRFAERERFLLA